MHYIIRLCGVGATDSRQEAMAGSTGTASQQDKNEEQEMEKSSSLRKQNQTNPQ